MHNTDETGYEKRDRAGFIPYLKDGNVYKYLMMVSSDPKFGGPRPMISKGKIESDEGSFDGAMREAYEELGLKKYNVRNIQDVASERVALYSGAYHLTLFAGEVIDRHDFDKWGDETSYTVWLSLEEFKEIGRRDHLRFIQMLEEDLKWKETHV